MARTQAEIKESITSSFISDVNIIAQYALVAGLTFLQQFALFSPENILFDTVTFGIWSLEQQFDIFRAEILAIIAQSRAHTRDWYRSKTLGFLFGVPTLPGTDIFDTTGLTDEQIATAKIIKQAAVIKVITQAGYALLRIKVATENANGDLEPVPADAFAALQYYIVEDVSDAGTQVAVTTGVADKLRSFVDIYFDPLVLSATGSRLDGTAETPVQDAANNFLKKILFNGRFDVQTYEMALKNVPGVIFAKVTAAASKYGGYSYDDEGIQNVGHIDMFRRADSGYFIMDDLQLNFKPYEQ